MPPPPRAAALLPVLLALPPAGGCSAGPPVERPLAGLGRVLALDFGADAMARRTHRLGRAGAWLPAEAHRPAAATARAVAGAPVELARAAAAAGDARTLIAAEAARRPAPPPGVVPAPARVAADLAESLAAVAAQFGVSHRPLAELDDADHRTGADDRPEPSLLRRLARRLGWW